MPIKVVLDIFSGLPNPSWALDSEQEAELLSRLNALQPAPDKDIPKPPGLGYRGFIAEPSTASELQGAIRIYKGIAQYAGKKYLDKDRQLERWLLESAGSNLNDKLNAEVGEELVES